MADDGEPRARPALSRRALLAGAAAVTAAAAGYVLGERTGSVRRPTRQHLSPTPTPTPTAIPVADGGAVTIERVHSAARGASVDLVTVRPDNLHHADLPVCLMLHGRLSSARRTLAGAAMPAFLEGAAEQGVVPPFTFVAVDGGNGYWHRQPDGDDPMAMLLDEVPRWLAERGLGGPDGQPFACAGVSMGGFGALLYARRRRERSQPLRAAAGIAPALFLSWAVMSKRKAFTDASEWAALDPLRHLDALGNLPVGVWCGTEDHLCLDGTRQFIREAKPVVGSLTPGGHDDAFYRKSLPEVVRFVGRYLPRPLPASTGPASG